MAGCDYANARIRAMRGRLLGPKGIAEVLAQPGLAARLEYLKKTDYGEAVAAHVAREPGPLRGAERGLRGRLVDDILRIDRFLGAGRARSLMRAVLAFEDGWNLKTVLRGIAKGEPADHIFLLLAPTPDLDDQALGELAGQSDVKSVVDLLATWGSPYALPLAEALPLHRAHRELLLLELALDRFLFARALEAARADGEDGRILLGFLETLIDLTNAGTLLKMADLARSDVLYIPGGRHIGLKLFQQLCGLPARELREALVRQGRLHLDLRLTLMGERGDPFDVDQVLRDVLRQAVRREARVHTLTVAVPLDFVLERQAEVRRIRLVLRGTEFGVPADELMALLER